MPGLFLPGLEAGRETPFGVRESQPAQDDALDELPGFGPAFEADDLRQHRGDGLDVRQLFARARQVVERARRRSRYHSPGSSRNSKAPST